MAELTIKSMGLRRAAEALVRAPAPPGDVLSQGRTSTDVGERAGTGRTVGCPGMWVAAATRTPTWEDAVRDVDARLPRECDPLHRIGEHTVRHSRDGAQRSAVEVLDRESFEVT